MLNVTDFYTASASDEWFTRSSLRKVALHDQLEARGFTLIDRPTLESKYKNLKVPASTVDLSYAPSIPTPKPDLKSAFAIGNAYEIRKRTFKDRMLSDVITEWLNTTLGDEKYIMSLSSNSYLVAKADSIDFEDIFTVIRGWSIDCFIGVFDKTGKTMFVFAEEFSVISVSFDPNNTPAEFTEVSSQFDSENFVTEVTARGGNLDRVEEYYEAAVKPFV